MKILVEVSFSQKESIGKVDTTSLLRNNAG